MPLTFLENRPTGANDRPGRCREGVKGHSYHYVQILILWAVEGSVFIDLRPPEAKKNAKIGLRLIQSYFFALL